MKKLFSIFVLFAFICSLASRVVSADNQYAGFKYIPHPFEDDVSKTFEWAKEMGLTTARNLQEFRSNDKITREEVAAVLYRLYKNKLLPIDFEETQKRATKNRFTDASQIAPEFIEAVSVLRQKGILKWSGWKFHPKNNITNHEVVMIAFNSREFDRKNLKDTDISRAFYNFVKRDVSLSAPATRDTFFRMVHSFQMCLLESRDEGVYLGCL